jgi:hypothetical protein
VYCVRKGWHAFFNFAITSCKTQDAIYMKKQTLGVLLPFIMLMFSSCTVIGDIFKAGVWSGIIVVVLVIVLIIWLIGRMGRK